MAVDAHGTIYASRGWGHVFMSNDSGSSWEELASLGGSVHAIAISGSCRLYAGTAIGVFRSAPV